MFLRSVFNLFGSMEMDLVKYHFSNIVFELDVFCLFFGQVLYTLFLENGHLRIPKHPDKDLLW